MALTSALATAIRDREAAEAIAREKSAVANRLFLAVSLAEAEVPAGSYVGLVTWDDEHNGDGTYVVALATVYDEDGEEIGDLGSGGAINADRFEPNANHYGTDYDEFLAVLDDDFGADEPLVISVDKVNAWVAENGWSES